MNGQSKRPEELKTSGIGASDSAAILGYGWSTALDIYLIKRGLVEKPEENNAMYWGKVHEPTIITEYERVTGFYVSRGSELIRHPEYPWMVGRVDGLIKELINPRDPSKGLCIMHGLEAKTASKYMAHEWGEPGTDEIPVYYLIQCQHYMAITGAPMFHVAVLIGGNDFRIYKVERNDRLIAQMIPKLSEFWQRVLSGDPPPADGGKVASEYLALKYPEEIRAKLVVADVEGEVVIANLIAIKTFERIIKEKKEQIQNIIKGLIGDCAYLVSEYAKISWKKNRDTVVTDWKAIVKELAPDMRIIERHTTTKKGARVFRLTATEKGDEAIIHISGKIINDLRGEIYGDRTCEIEGQTTEGSATNGKTALGNGESPTPDDRQTTKSGDSGNDTESVTA